MFVAPVAVVAVVALPDNAPLNVAAVSVLPLNVNPLSPSIVVASVQTAT